ncbi:hypothetical protein ACQJBY_003025 [Aegilops geniculata]
MGRMGVHCHYPTRFHGTLEWSKPTPLRHGGNPHYSRSPNHDAAVPSVAARGQSQDTPIVLHARAMPCAPFFLRFAITNSPHTPGAPSLSPLTTVRPRTRHRPRRATESAASRPAAVPSRGREEPNPQRCFTFTARLFVICQPSRARLRAAEVTRRQRRRSAPWQLGGVASTSAVTPVVDVLK